MDYYTFGAIILTISVLISYLNHRFVRLQTTIAVMTASLVVSIVWLSLDALKLLPATLVTQFATKSHFQDLLLKGMLGYLLFAGSLTIDVKTLLDKRSEIAVLAVFTTLASAILIGLLSHYLLSFLGLSIPLLYCFLFGALISPTDPIAVLATFKNLHVSKTLQTTVAGESLFNDGVGIVLFATVSALTFEHAPVTFMTVSGIFLTQALGGLAFGGILGFIAQRMLNSLDDHKMLILLTLGLVTSGYTLALKMGISGPLAMVVLGIMVGHTMRHSTHQTASHSLEVFWEVIDEILNLILFLLIGLEMVVIQFNLNILLAMLIAIPLVLLVRLITVAVPMSLISLRKSQEPYTIAILTWGGLRGGLALALALSLPQTAYTNLIVAMTYGAVAFSVIVQGLTIAPLARLANRKACNPP